MHAITYWVIRFVPDTARGEFQNIGVVCGSDKGDWSVEFDWHYVRSRTPADVGEWARWFAQQVAQREMIEPSHEFTRGWIEGIRQRQANTVQISEGRPVSAESSFRAVTLLYQRLIARPQRSRLQGKTRRSLRAGVRGIYARTPLRRGRDYFEQPSIRLGQLHGQFDFVQINEELPIIRNVWSFDLAGLEGVERDIQAWNYEVTRLRGDGAKLISASRVIELSADSVVTAVVDPPSSDSARRSDVYEAALEAWVREKVDVLTLEQFDERLVSSLST